MKTNICSFCLKSGILCRNCQEKLRTGEVTKLDIEVGRNLLDLEEKNPSLQKISFYRAYESNGVLALVVGQGGLSTFLNQGGKILRELEKSFHKRIRVVERGGDLRTFLESLFMPAEIVSINKIWIPDGTTETRVILSGSRRKLPIDQNSIKKLAREIEGITLRVEFERERRRR